jgi:RNA polymerase sigma factor (sigma-70 family)
MRLPSGNTLETATRCQQNLGISDSYRWQSPPRSLLMLGDSAAAQDVVQDAFLGLYRRWDKLADTGAAPAYLRTSVLNGCRTALKQRSRVPFQTASELLESAEAALIHTEEQRAVLAAVRRLPARQREVLVLRYYLDMTEDQAAQAMGVSRGTVKSATSRAVAAVGRMVKEDIRDSLRSEADRLREVPPLHLPPAVAHHRPPLAACPRGALAAPVAGPGHGRSGDRAYRRGPGDRQGDAERERGTPGQPRSRPGVLRRRFLRRGRHPAVLRAVRLGREAGEPGHRGGRRADREDARLVQPAQGKLVRVGGKRRGG